MVMATPKPNAHGEPSLSRFSTTKPIGTGTGLGLAIAYKIIETHKGQIDVHSEIGHGATFRISLPRQPANLE
jgi:signal transduction histidine kinase